MAGRVEGKVAFVTGAARGQGRSHAVRLAQEGADIIALDICGPIRDNALIEPSTPEDMAETVEAVKGLNRRIVTVQADVRDFDAVKSAVDDGVAQLGRLDIVVANAGIGTGGTPLHQTDEFDWQEMQDINLSGVWKTVKAAVPHIIEGGNGGSIILTSSVGGLKAYPNTGPYIAAKHGVVGLMRSFAVELGEHFIRVNTVHPTNVNTPMFMNEGAMKMFRPDLENPGPDDLKVAAQFMHVLPIGWVEPEDISQCGAVPRVGRVAVRHGPDPDRRRRQHARVVAPHRTKRSVAGPDSAPRGVERRRIVFCAPGRIRTCDTRFRRAVLYPLSYEGARESRRTGSWRAVSVAGGRYRRRSERVLSRVCPTGTAGRPAP